MEILDLKFAGVPVWLILVIVGLWYNVRHAYREWRKNRDTSRQLDEALRNVEAEHVSRPHPVGGVDCGEWVRKE